LATYNQNRNDERAKCHPPLSQIRACKWFHPPHGRVLILGRGGFLRAWTTPAPFARRTIRSPRLSLGPGSV